MANFTQDMEGNRAFPPKPSPDRSPSLRSVPQKVKVFGAEGEKFKGYGEQGTDIELNTEAPHGNIKLTPAGKFVQQQMYKGTQLSQPAPVETSIRNVRVADLGPEFGRGPLDGGIELAGEKRSLPKKFLPGGRAV